MFRRSSFGPRAVDIRVNPRTANRRTANRRTVNRRTVNRRTANRRTVNRRTVNRRTANRRTANRRTANRRTANRRTANRRTVNRRTASRPHGGNSSLRGGGSSTLGIKGCPGRHSSLRIHQDSSRSSRLTSHSRRRGLGIIGCRPPDRRLVIGSAIVRAPRVQRRLAVSPSVPVSPTVPVQSYAIIAPPLVVAVVAAA